MMRSGLLIARVGIVSALCFSLSVFGEDTAPAKPAAADTAPPAQRAPTPPVPPTPPPRMVKPRTVRSGGLQPVANPSQPSITPGFAGPNGGVNTRPTPLAPPGYVNTALNPSPIPAAAVPQPPLLPSTSLAWDSESKEYKAKVGDTNAHFTFWLTNVCDKEVLVNSVRTSCGCTVAKLPETPWHIKPSSNGPITVTVDLRGKRGKVVKTVTADTTAGIKSLLVTVDIPVDPQLEAQAGRSQNMQLALQDRQIVFRGDCASCHVEKGRGKMGQDLYAASCGICHEAEHRASMVPDLKALKVPTSLQYWTHWIKEGKPGTLMPAFAQDHGGPLTPEQVASLADWLTANYKGAAVQAPGAPATPAKATAQ